MNQDVKHMRKYVDLIKEVSENCAAQQRTPAQLKEYINALCIECLMPHSPECIVCSPPKLTEDIENQLELNFKGEENNDSNNSEVM